MALNTCKKWFNGKITFFTKKLPSGWGLRPQTPVCDTVESHQLSQHVSKVRYLHFWTISLSPLSLQIPGYVPTGNDFRSSIRRYVCPFWNFFFGKILMTSFHVICGLGLPNQKFWVRLWIGNRLKKFFWRPFILENTCGCVLGPWLRAFLSLASRGSVLGKAVLGLGFFCVLGLGLEPCVLDSNSA